MQKVKHTIRDLIINLITWSGLAFVYRAYVRRKGPLVRVLCFHDVADQAWFASVLDMLRTHYHVLTPEQFAQQEFEDGKINILITFDDGYDSWITHAAPELEKRGMRGLFFVSSGLLDTSDTPAFYKKQMHISPKTPLTWEGVQKLRASGHTIGGHTINHTRLSTATPEEARGEVEKDKARHEEMLGIPLVHFAYPFGTTHDYTDDTIKVVKEAVYTYQYSAATGFTRVGDVSDIIPRTLIENNQSPNSIAAWINGSYDVFVRMLGR